MDLDFEQPLRDIQSEIDSLETRRRKGDSEASSKLSALRRVLEDYNSSRGTDFGLGNCAYMGDDIIDLECMKAIKDAGGVAACPADAVDEVKAVADFVASKNGGYGAVREIIRQIETSCN